MITISLDEQGLFENKDSSLNNIIMIAGIVYDDCGDSFEAEREKTRIRKYFEMVCESCENAEYPCDLHIGNNNRRNNKVRQVKRKYSSTLGDFLKKGQYEGRDILCDGRHRTGKYYTYAFVKSKDGKQHLAKADIGNLINENNASNLYMHMVEDVLSKLLFYNNIFANQKEVAFDLATRIYKGGIEEDISNYTDIGYGIKTLNDGKLVYLTNTDVFRTSLERDMLSKNKTDIEIKYLNTRSIRYTNNTRDDGYEFLYLADAVCTCLGFNNNYLNDYLDNTWERMEKLTGNNRLLFSYDNVDTEFTRAWEAVENGYIYNALDIAFDILQPENVETKFYKKVWEKELFLLISKKIDVSAFIIAIEQYSRSMRNNNINQQKMIYIYKQLEKLIQNISFSDSWDKTILYDFYTAGASAYNHIGNSQKANECLNKRKEYIPFISMEKEIRNRNKLSVSLCGSFRYLEAEKIAMKNYQYCNAMYEIQSKIFKNDILYNSTEYGVTCSQLGQIYSYMLDERAENMFCEALNILKKGTPDYYITESYLLHYYLTIKNKEKYTKYAKEYFGGNDDLQKQLHYLILAGSDKKNPIISLKFAIYVYLKSITTFYLNANDISKELISQLLNIEQTISNICKSAGKEINGHPWEISYKHLAIIALYFKETKIATEYTKKIDTCIKNKGNTARVIEFFNKAELLKLKNKNYDSEIKQIQKLLISLNPTLLNKIKSFEDLEEIITYMYR